MMIHRISILALLATTLLASGCRYVGSAMPAENPISMDQALATASGQGGSNGRSAIRHPTRPQVQRPSYLPEKELALVSPPKTLLMWTYPHITDDNTRVFGSWSTIFLTDKYEWARPANELPEGTDDNSGSVGRPNLGADVSALPPEATGGQPPILPDARQ